MQQATGDRAPSWAWKWVTSDQTTVVMRVCANRCYRSRQDGNRQLTPEQGVAIKTVGQLQETRNPPPLLARNPPPLLARNAPPLLARTSWECSPVVCPSLGGVLCPPT